jgi:hypothetical protein
MLDTKILCLQTTPWTLLPDECRVWLVANPTTSCQAARWTQHRSQCTVSPSRSPTLGPNPSHIGRGGEAVVRVVCQYATVDVANASPVEAMRQREGSAVIGQRLDKSAAAQREDETAAQQEVMQQPAGVTRQREGGALRGQR